MKVIDSTVPSCSHGLIMGSVSVRVLRTDISEAMNRDNQNINYHHGSGMHSISKTHFRGSYRPLGALDKTS